MANNPLSSESLLKLMAEALPSHAASDTNSDLSSSYEAIALLSHACMIAVGFRLIGLGEGDKIKPEDQSSDSRLPSSWNSSFGSHSFLYAHSQSSMQYVVKIDRMGSKAEVRGVGLGDERISRFEVTAKDYVSSSALPLRITMQATGEDRSDLEGKLQSVLVSASRIQDFVSLFKITIVQKLMPGIRKEGYEEAPNDPGREAAASVSEQREEEYARRNPRADPLRYQEPPPARPYPFDDPLAPGPRRPIPMGDFPPPGFDDEYDLQRPPHGFRPGMGSPFGIGHDDLNPPGLGPNDPLRGSFIGGGGLPRPGGSGGMHPTFDDPLFGGRGGQGNIYDPMAPPGARYDPVGPGARPPRGAGGRPPNPFGGFGGNDFI